MPENGGTSLRFRLWSTGLATALGLVVGSLEPMTIFWIAAALVGAVGVVHLLPDSANEWARALVRRHQRLIAPIATVLLVAFLSSFYGMASRADSPGRRRMIRMKTQEFIAEGQAIDSFAVMGYGLPWTPPYFMRVGRIRDWENRVLDWADKKGMDSEVIEWEAVMDTSRYWGPDDPGMAKKPIQDRINILRSWPLRRPNS